MKYRKVPAFFLAALLVLSLSTRAEDQPPPQPFQQTPKAHDRKKVVLLIAVANALAATCKSKRYKVNEEAIVPLLRVTAMKPEDVKSLDEDTVAFVGLYMERPEKENCRRAEDYFGPYGELIPNLVVKQ